MRDLNNDSIKQPAAQPKLEHNSKRKKRSPKKRIYLLVALVVIILLAIGGVVYMLWMRGNRSQTQSVPSCSGENSVTGVDRTDQDDLTCSPISKNSPPSEFQYLLQPIVCCVLMVINVGITLLLVSKFKLVQKENLTQKRWNDLHTNMSKWIAQINEIYLETNLIKNEGLKSVMFKLGSISEKLEALANAIRSDRDKIQGGK